ERASGVLLHPTSLPGRHGSGDLGLEARVFARWLRGAGQRWWQMLPVGPLGHGNSPYSAHSAFAGNPLLVSLGRLVEDGLLRPRDLADAPGFPEGRVDHAAVRAFRGRYLRKAFAAFENRARDRGGFDAFCASNSAWLDDFALYIELKLSRGGKDWTEWDLDLCLRVYTVLERYLRCLRVSMSAHAVG